MKKLVLVILLFVIAISCGCVQTPATTDETPESTAVPTQIQTVAQTSEPTAAPAEPFPDAIPLGQKFVYGDEEDGRILTLYNAFVVPSYWYHPVAHGYDWEYTPAEGNQFLFLELKIKHNGTKTELGAPHPNNINVWFKGQFYPHLAERDDATAPVTDPADVVDDYYGGVIKKPETLDGFLIFEVPNDLTFDRAYVQVNLGNVYGAPVWKLMK